MPRGNRRDAGLNRIAFEVYGVTVSVTVGSPDLLDSVEAVLPPGREPREPSQETDLFSLTRADGAYHVRGASGRVAVSPNLANALAGLDSRLRMYIATTAPHHIFIHAGVVAHCGRALVIPGPPGSGKTSLTAALVRAGAIYYSDEFAVLDTHGLVHPYAKPLSIRGEDGRTQTDIRVEALGGVAGVEPSPVGLIAFAHYRPGGEWQPRRLTPGDAALALLSHTLPARERPHLSITAITQALRCAIALRGDRGEAANIVGQLLESVGTKSAPDGSLRDPASS